MFLHIFFHRTVQWNKTSALDCWRPNSYKVSTANCSLKKLWQTAGTKIGFFWCARSVFPLHGSYKKEEFDKFILLFYNMKFKERQSITIHAERDLKQMALFQENLNQHSYINNMQTLTWCILDLATSIKAPLSAFWFEESLFVLLPDCQTNKRKCYYQSPFKFSLQILS